MRKTEQIRIRKTTTAAGGTYDYVKSGRVSAGEFWVIQHTAYENQTGARGTFRRYIDRGDYNHYLGEHQSPGAAELITSDAEVWLMQGDELVIRQASATASDVLALYCTGYKVYADDIGG